ncbi:MAG: Glucose-6-phosphate isomerase [Alphaproteobacteria bacterium MarineAlpha5_Bin9]|nr:MAG: Glucose-6-phosphate isomerase [Alphaproteobacteria bacterium MarineAlpha5_Bin9]|tara:strand:- start:15307 stop:16539 length:1233 start_codon:yes stop_codon:yes gene_type:complete
MINFNIKYQNNILDNFIKKFDKNKVTYKKINKKILNIPALNIDNLIKDIKNIKKIKKKFINNKKKIIILATGGSSLGAKALINLYDKNLKKKIDFIDNIDPIIFASKIKKLNLMTTGFIIISKSGKTPETLSQLSALVELISKQKNKKNILRNFIIISENNNNPLRKIAKKIECIYLVHDSKIGGRYSIFSKVGLFPASLIDIDINNFLRGAKSVINEVKKNNFNQHLIGATVHKYLIDSLSVNMNVIMTYSDLLYYFGKWYLQLWSESIGKNKKGSTPIHSIGTTDQHSQLQLYLDGPRDKYFTFITTDHTKKGLKMNKAILNYKETSFFSEKNMGDLMQAEQVATLKTFRMKKIFFREINLKKFDEYSMGQLFAFFIIETIATCYLSNVNPFNQPAVEIGKKLVKKFI